MPRGGSGSVVRGILTFAVVLVCLAVFLGTAEARRYASIVIDAETGVVLHEAQADARIYPASLTKMMTLYLLFEALEDGVLTPDDKLIVSRRAAGQPPTDLGLRAGQTITVDLAIRALVVRSANDVATVVAEALGGTEFEFAQSMTRKARALGMAKTTFQNASGLPHRSQVSTVRDLATLARALMHDFPQYYHYFSLESLTYKGRTYRTHNHLVTRYPGADGLKTGYIRASGYNLAASATRNGDRLIAIVVGGTTAQSRDTHMTALLDRGFANVVAARGAATVAAATSADGGYVVPPQKPPVPSSAIAVAMSVLVPSAEAAISNAELAGPWAIQVGAFSQFEPAQRVAMKAARDAATMLRDARVVVLERGNSSRTLYRARIIGLTEQDARSACRLLEAKKTSCLVVRLDESVALSSAP